VILLDRASRVTIASARRPRRIAGGTEVEQTGEPSSRMKTLRVDIAVKVPGAINDIQPVESGPAIESTAFCRPGGGCGSFAEGLPRNDSITM